jgi:hypothetical protein
VLATLIAGVTEAVHTRIDGAVKEVVTSIRGSNPTSSGIDRTARVPEPAIRAD